eukprot:TRINITY_DN14789_c0_g1_i1.p1 TRINITY_DN14789_c0_g1~~TRINITY_DN14789_c0_g1_i1.p1  ORF type:complete len:104 (+),score=5.17 TRINITY_DN14789_c0_g1_i1:101-412(+)
MPFAGEHVPASGNWCTCDMYSAVRRGLAFSSGLHISSDAICSISISFNCPTAHNGCVGLYIDCYYPASIAALHTWSGAAWGVPPDSLATQSAAGDCISPSNSV